MITVSKEDYLKAILEAESEGETVISATLAHWLSVSPPAVSMALRRLKKDRLVRVHKDGQVRLTAAGRRIAHKLTLRHHLIERMLFEIFGMEWFKVHPVEGVIELSPGVRSLQINFDSRILPLEKLLGLFAVRRPGDPQGQRRRDLGADPAGQRGGGLDAPGLRPRQQMGRHGGDQAR